MKLLFSTLLICLYSSFSFAAIECPRNECNPNNFCIEGCTFKEVLEKSPEIYCDKQSCEQAQSNLCQYAEKAAKNTATKNCTKENKEVALFNFKKSVIVSKKVSDTLEIRFCETTARYLCD